MYPVLLRWRGIRIHSYSALLYLGMVFGIMAGSYAARLSGLNVTRVFVAMVALIVAGLIGSRLLFVVTNWRLYRREPWRMWRRSEGGAALQGGLLAALLFSVPVLATMELPFGVFWDIAVFPLSIGLIFARLGCLLHGCCGGHSTIGLLALYLPDQNGVWRWRVPTQLLELTLGILILLGSISLWHLRPFLGFAFLLAVAVYAWSRFFIEPMREQRDWLGTFDIQQFVAAAIGTAALVALLVAALKASF
jgi:phosphatidylglycerol:prolipoprotein diacylglycerol transferase